MLLLFLSMLSTTNLLSCPYDFLGLYVSSLLTDDCFISWVDKTMSFFCLELISGPLRSDPRLSLESKLHDPACASFRKGLYFPTTCLIFIFWLNETCSLPLPIPPNQLSQFVQDWGGSQDTEFSVIKLGKSGENQDHPKTLGAVSSLCTFRP